jgi:hypothetical protein
MLLCQLRLMEAEDFWRQVNERDMAMMTSDVALLNSDLVLIRCVVCDV